RAQLRLGEDAEERETDEEASYLTNPVRYISNRSASSLGRARAGRWPPSISSGVIPRRSRTTRRMNAAGKKRSSRHSRKRVGTSGHASSGHGFSNGVSDC